MTTANHPIARRRRRTRRVARVLLPLAAVLLIIVELCFVVSFAFAFLWLMTHDGCSHPIENSVAFLWCCLCAPLIAVRLWIGRESS